MLRHLFVLLLCLPGFSAWAQQAPLVQFDGKILDVADSMGLPYVHIWGNQSRVGTTSAIDGSFSLMVQPGDTLRFSSVGYVTRDWVVPFDVAKSPSVTLVLYREQYNIDEVTVMPKPDLRKDFLGDVPVTEPPVSPHFPHTPTFGVSPGGGITFGFDSKAKHLREQQQQIAMWTYEETMRQYIAYRYNPTIIQQFVPITDAQMESFLRFCNMNPDFIVESSDYELAVAIKQCYVAFSGKN